LVISVSLVNFTILTKVTEMTDLTGDEISVSIRF